MIQSFDNILDANFLVVIPTIFFHPSGMMCTFFETDADNDVSRRNQLIAWEDENRNFALRIFNTQLIHQFMEPCMSKLILEFNAAIDIITKISLSSIRILLQYYKLMVMYLMLSIISFGWDYWRLSIK